MRCGPCRSGLPSRRHVRRRVRRDHRPGGRCSRRAVALARAGRVALAPSGGRRRAHRRPGDALRHRDGPPRAVGPGGRGVPRAGDRRRRRRGRRGRARRPGRGLGTGRRSMVAMVASIRLASTASIAGDVLGAQTVRLEPGALVGGDVLIAVTFTAPSSPPSAPCSGPSRSRFRPCCSCCSCSRSPLAGSIGSPRPLTRRHSRRSGGGGRRESPCR